MLNYYYYSLTQFILHSRERSRIPTSRILRVILNSDKTVLSDIGIPINKYAFLNIVYFSLAYIWLTDQTKSNFRLLPSLLSETVQLKEKTLLLRIFSFRCILLPCVMGYRFVFCTFSKSFIDFME